MATREENLKKINDELEKLDDEQLEQVVGGAMTFSDETIFNKNKLNWDRNSDKVIPM